VLKNNNLCKYLLLIFTVIIFMRSAEAAQIVDKRKVVPVGALLDPNSSHYGKELIVYGYFKVLGSEAGKNYGSLCIDREASKNNYYPFCITVIFSSKFKISAKAANGKFVLVQGIAEVESILSTYPGSLTDVSRIERFESY